MKHYFTLVISIFLLSLYGAQAQNPKDFTVMLKVTTQKTPKPSITIGWSADPLAKHYQIFRRAASSITWGQPIADLDSVDKEYKDTDIEIGKEYEYQVLKKNVVDSVNAYLGVAYVTAGIEVLPPVWRGKVLLLVDSMIVAPLANEINRLIKDLKAEAWNVVFRYVGRTEVFDGNAVKNVKAVIMQEYNNDKANLKSVFILGRVAVPYSGNINPDAHDDHQGAWPADCYYGDIDGIWADKKTNSTLNPKPNSYPENINIPGDGKFDVSTFDDNTLSPITIELQVGRVDFCNMPAFTDTSRHKTLFDSEVELLKRYLDKNHAYRTGSYPNKAFGVIADNFGVFKTPGGLTESFANSGWRNFSALLGESNIKEGDYFTMVADTNVLWAYGCGPGSPSTCGKVGSTSDFITKPVNAVFTMLFGSYFGDWNSQNNIMRAVLASKGSALTCSWAGRPHTYYHQMGLGNTIGASTVLSQNNSYDYYFFVLYNLQYPNGVLMPTYGTRWVHQSLLGDPTLRMNVNKGAIPKPDIIGQTVPTGSTEAGSIHLYWNFESSSDKEKVDGYFLYRADSPTSNFKQVNTQIITEEGYTDSSVTIGKTYSYFLRAASLRYSATGSYYDMSDSLSIIASPPVGVHEANQVVTGLECSPIPAIRYTDIHFTMEQVAETSLEISDLSGNKVASLGTNKYSSGEQTVRWNLTDSRGSSVSAGVYLLTLTHDKHSQTIKLVVAN